MPATQMPSAKDDGSNTTTRTVTRRTLPPGGVSRHQSHRP